MTLLFDVRGRRHRQRALGRTWRARGAGGAARGAARWLTATTLAWLVLTTGPAAAALDATTAAALDQAVAAYQAGKLAQAQREFEALARAGVPAASFNLGVMHLRGELPGARVSRGRQLLERAAQEGFVTAMFTLGQAWETGQLGKPDGGRSSAAGNPGRAVQNDNKAALAESLRWYQRAAEAGSADGQVATATAYYLGRGVRQDKAVAARWYREAAKAGDVGAQYLIASMYEHGDGLPLDLRLARYWYDVAASNGDVAAPGKVKELDAKAGQSVEKPETPETPPTKP